MYVFLGALPPLFFIAFGQQLHEKVLNIATHQGNANQNYKKASPYTYKNSYYQKDNSW